MVCRSVKRIMRRWLQQALAASRTSLGALPAAAVCLSSNTEPAAMKSPAVVSSAVLWRLILLVFGTGAASGRGSGRLCLAECLLSDSSSDTFWRECVHSQVRVQFGWAQVPSGSVLLA